MTQAATKRSTRILIALAIASVVLYGVIGHLSHAFAYGSDKQARPMLLVLSLFVMLFGLYLAATNVATRADGRPTIRIVIAAAIVFRVILLFSEPIQEVDIYRYLWDGAVSQAGVSPFRYAPKQVLDGLQTLPARAEPELLTLVKLCQSDEHVLGVLKRVHWGQVKTVYPPVSQAAFYAVDWLTPDGTSVDKRVRIMRAVLVLFDVATIAVVLALLRLTGLPGGLVTGYAWCPLLIKECANSGHLDSIVVLLTTIGIYCVVRSLRAFSQTGNQSTASRIMPAWLLLGCIVLALGVGAKIYPIVCLPWLVAVCWRKSWLSFAGPLVFLVGSWLVMAPMLPQSILGNANDRNPENGLEVFIKYWEMNDFLFLIVAENLKPTEPDRPDAWFIVTPNFWRERIVAWSSATFGWQPGLAPFLLTRCCLGSIFGIAALGIAVWARRQDETIAWLQAAFLTIAWFWLLSPTQNPWYWTWTLPLLPFMRSKVWWAMSGLLFIYYLRFWFEYHYPNSSVAGTPYASFHFFDLVVSWIEFAPWFAWLGISLIAPRSVARKR